MGKHRKDSRNVTLTRLVSFQRKVGGPVSMLRSLFVAVALLVSTAPAMARVNYFAIAIQETAHVRPVQNTVVVGVPNLTTPQAIQLSLQGAARYQEWLDRGLGVRYPR